MPLPLARTVLTLVVLLSSALNVAPAEADDREDALATLEAYHRALAAQDSSAAVGLLATDLVVLEGGWPETYEEYLGHHLGADMEFASQVGSEREILQAVVQGDVAWISSTSTMQGEFRGHAIHSAGTELIVLSRIDGAWKIRAIHWSSRRLEESN